MSIKVMDMVADRQFASATEKQVLMAMANYASDCGNGIWASNSTIGDRIGVTRETVSRNIKRLTEQHLIEQTGKKKPFPGSTAWTIIYRINLRVLSSLELTETAKNHRKYVEDQGVTEDHNAAEGCDPDDVCDVTEDHNNRPENRPKDKTNVLSKRESVLELTPSDVCDQVEEAYNAMAKRTGLPRCAKMTSSRQKAIMARYREAGSIEPLIETLHRVENTPFLLGDNDRGWKADIEFIFRESGFTKITEGKYDGGNHVQQRPSRSAGGGGSGRASGFHDRMAQNDEDRLNAWADAISEERQMASTGASLGRGGS